MAAPSSHHSLQSSRLVELLILNLVRFPQGKHAGRDAVRLTFANVDGVASPSNPYSIHKARIARSLLARFPPSFLVLNLGAHAALTSDDLLWSWLRSYRQYGTFISSLCQD